MKKIVFNNTHDALLENFDSLDSKKIDNYEGYVYAWKCLPEQRLYIGSHIGTVKDGYDGSGTLFRQVFRHYGATQFKRVILEYVEKKDDVKRVEQRWLDKFSAVRSSLFYNKRNALTRNVG